MDRVVGQPNFSREEAGSRRGHGKKQTSYMHWEKLNGRLIWVCRLTVQGYLTETDVTVVEKSLGVNDIQEEKNKRRRTSKRIKFINTRKFYFLNL